MHNGYTVRIHSSSLAILIPISVLTHGFYNTLLNNALSHIEHAGLNGFPQTCDTLSVNLSQLRNRGWLPSLRFAIYSVLSPAKTTKAAGASSDPSGFQSSPYEPT